MKQKQRKGVQEEVGERLRAIREAFGYSSADFAEALGIGVEMYRNYWHLRTTKRRQLGTYLKTSARVFPSMWDSLQEKMLLRFSGVEE